MKSVLRLLARLAVTLALLAFWAWQSEPLLDAMARRGWFGSCFEGACGYAAAFLYWPLLSLGLTVVSLMLILWLKRRAWR